VRTLPYSFNRSSVLDCLLTWRVDPLIKNRYTDDISNKDCLVGFAFGERTNGIDSNEHIACLANHFSLPCIAQEPVAHYLSRLPGSWYIALKDSQYSDLPFRDPRGCDYVNSYQVALAVAAICKEKNWESVGVLTTPQHQITCIMILKKLGLKAFAVDCSEVPYSPQNKQKWVRNKFVFAIYSVFVRLFFLWKGWI
jgi:hypothetical protein